MATFRLPDGRPLMAERFDERMWSLRVEGDSPGEIVGWPLNSTLAELLGYRPEHDEWPKWIDDLAQEIEEALPG